MSERRTPSLEPGTTVLMSGGTRGIGLAIAVRLAQAGANIVMLAKTDKPHPVLPGTLQEAADAVVAAGGHAHSVVGDVRVDEDIERAVAQAMERFGRIDVVVNNASAIDLSPTQALTPKRYDLMQDINVRGTFMLSRAAMPHLLEQRQPRVLSLSPPLNPTPQWLGAHTAYTVAKFGMTMVTLGLAAEFGDRGLSATTLWPRTTIATAAVSNLLGGDKVMRLSRTPQIYADAAFEVLACPGTYAGRSVIVEDVLEACGVTDFSQYAAVPGTPDSAMFPDIFLD
ncbi:SDR family oxidoreductase [Demequina sp. B12]|uniref:SDR family oxidoreductase n=1 Tax=Demequina sp. B12 TaxID=2992757 RepID=UPI00237A0A03|nr:SDR family oxidoreductase [Demequina sp. B12]MDE0573115.1 SDR family oxidoreductase [Demequina sp. B12]